MLEKTKELTLCRQASKLRLQIRIESTGGGDDYTDLPL